MKGKDTSNNITSSELDRLKGILFPKKTRHPTSNSTFIYEEEPIAKTEPINPSIKTQIQKLREQINAMLANGPNENLEVQQTERTYLNGINKMTKALRNYSAQINEVFEQFLTHLPTNLAFDNKNFTTHYFLSMLLQNCIWGKINSFFNRHRRQAFKAIKQEAIRIKEEQETHIQIQNERELRIKNKIQAQMNKYFWAWRFNTNCINLEEKNAAFMRESCIQNDKRVIKHINNLPLLVLILQQLCRSSSSNSDLSQILIYDSKNHTFCKFFEDGYECLNTSLQTVTQRSLLSCDRTNTKFKRFEFVSKRSLTALCVSRKQIIFVPNILNHPDYSQVDNNCVWQSVRSPRVVHQSDSLVLYPLFDRSGQLIGVLRQYFSQRHCQHVPQEQLEKISSLIEQGLEFERHFRMISKEKHYQKENYYLKMIKLLKTLENIQGNEIQPFKILQNHLSQYFNIQDVSVYQIDPQGSLKRQKMLHKIYGNTEECNQLLPVVDQFIKYGTSHLYLNNRLAICSNMMLFDLKLNSDADLTERQKLLPVQLFSSAMGKVEQIISHKQKERILFVQQEERKIQQDKENKIQQYQNKLQQQCLKLISKVNIEQNIFCQIKYFLSQLEELRCQYYEKKDPKDLELFINVSIENKYKVVQKTYNFRQQGWIQSILDEKDQNLMVIKINSCIQLLLKYQWSSFMFVSAIQEALTHCSHKYIQNHLKQSDRSIEASIILQGQNVVDQQIKHMISRKDKKEWQLVQLNRIYKQIIDIVQRFVSKCWKTNEKIQLNRKEPFSGNIEEWKSLIYHFEQSDPSKIEALIHSLEPTIGNIQYNQGKVIFPSLDNLITKRSILTLSINKNSFKNSKFSHDSFSIEIQLPIYFNLSEISEDSKLKSSVNKFIQGLRQYWLRLCKTFIATNSAIGINITKVSANKIMSSVGSFSQKRLHQYWNTLKQHSLLHKKRIDEVGKLKKLLQRAINRQLIVNFNALKYRQKKRQIKYSDSQIVSRINQLMNSLKMKIFYHPFNVIRKSNKQEKGTEQCFKIIEKGVNRINKWNLQQTFNQICYKTQSLTHNELGFNVLSFITRNKLTVYFQQLKSCKRIHNQIQNTSDSRCILEEATNLHELSKLIQKILPNYKLYLTVDTFNCYVLSSPSKDTSIINLEQAMNPIPSLSLYQAGTEGQLLWHCPCPLDNFAIKDQLNSLSKSIQGVINRCKASYRFSLSSLGLLKLKWGNYIKGKYFRSWREQREHLAMLEKNRLNDSLYQLSVENQTMKDKLNIQEKTLKSNLSMHKHIQTKQQQYQSLISFSRQRVQYIEQASLKLQNTRNIYLALHRRTVLKNIMLVWRSNAQSCKLQEKINNINFSALQKVAVKSIISVIQPKVQRALHKVFQTIHSIRKGKDVMVSKLTVSFDENTDRLVTFQSEMPKDIEIDFQRFRHLEKQKQNSSQRSNVSSPDSKSTFRSIGRLKMSKMNQENKLGDLSAEQINKHNNGIYKLNPKTLKFLKRMGKLEQ